MPRSQDCGFKLLLNTHYLIGANGAVIFSCDFDTDFCDLTQGTDDNYDWSRGSITPSANTGPDDDHTSGTGMNMEEHPQTILRIQL